MNETETIEERTAIYKEVERHMKKNNMGLLDAFHALYPERVQKAYEKYHKLS